MANELQHKSVGSQLSQTEYEHTDGTGHTLDSQAIGDIIYASSTTVLKGLGIGSTGAVLTVTGGIPAWDTTWTPTGHLIPATDDSYDLGSASAAWQDLFLEGDITLTDAGTLATSAGALTITSAAAATWSTGAGALTITSAAALNLNPTAGSAILLDGTISVDAGVVTGATSITSTAFVGALTGNADTSTLATTVTITDNESTSETNAVIFTAGGDVDGGNLGLESDGDFTYNPSSGTASATIFSGALSGNATTATALATGRTIASTGDVTWTSASFTGSGNVTGTAAIGSGVIVNADVNASAAIAYSKLASLSDGNILVGNGSNVATSVNPSGDIDIANDGTFSISSAVIVNADISGSAAIADSKIVDALTISGGTVNNSVIGGSTAAAITGTTIDAGTDFTIGDTVITNGVITDSTGLSIAAAVDLGSNTLTTTGNIELGHATANTLSASSGELSIESVVVKKVGTENMWVPVTAMTPRDDSPCSDITTVAAGTAGKPDFRIMDFDKDSDEFAQFVVAMPKSWDGGNIYFYAYWIGLASTDGVAWALEVLSLNDNEEFNQAYANVQVVQDDSQGDVTELLVSAKSSAIACSGADNDLLCFQVFRDVSDGNDDMGGDARLWGLLIEYTTSASTDA